MTKASLLPALIAIAILFATPAYSVEFDSEFVDFNLSKCATLANGNSDAAYDCPGHDGVPLHITKTDRQTFVSFGETAAAEKAADQTLPGFNRVHSTIEWRYIKKNGEWLPFATIQRWFTDDGKGLRGEILVVTKLKEGNTCHIAYIDAVVTPLAFHTARNLADLLAPKFRCNKDEPQRTPG